jgi:hypothetical protein
MTPTSDHISTARPNVAVGLVVASSVATGGEEPTSISSIPSRSLPSVRLSPAPGGSVSLKVRWRCACITAESLPGSSNDECPDDHQPRRRNARYNGGSATVLGSSGRTSRVISNSDTTYLSNSPSDPLTANRDPNTRCARVHYVCLVRPTKGCFAEFRRELICRLHNLIDAFVLRGHSREF